MSDKEKKADEPKKVVNKKYTVNKKLTADKVYKKGETIILDSEAEATKYLLNTKHIK